MLLPRIRDVANLAPHQMLFVAIAITTLSLAALFLFAEVDRVVVARGKSVSGEPRILIRPLAKGRVTKIHVRLGDLVSEGQPLVTLDPATTEADLRKMDEKAKSLKAQVARLRAELDGRRSKTLRDASVDESFQAELLDSSRQEYQHNLQKLLNEESRLREKRDGLTAKLGVIAKRLAVASEIEEMWERLVKDLNYGSKLNWAKARQDRLDLMQREAEAQSELAETRAALAKAQAERLAFVGEWRTRKLEELQKIEREQKEAEQEVVKARFSNAANILASPFTAVVTEVADLSPGGVVDSQDVLVKLVPAETPRFIEVRISAEDVSFVQFGQKVVIKLDSLPFQKHGTLSGILKTLTHDSLEASSERSARELSSDVKAISSDKEPYFFARIEITSNELKNLPETYRLLPGIPVTAEIKVGTRRLVEYVLYPIMRVASEGMREP